MRGDNPKNWLPCNRPLSPSEKMYGYAIGTPSDVGGLREGESRGVHPQRLSYGVSGRGPGVLASVLKVLGWSLSVDLIKRHSEDR